MYRGELCTSKRCKYSHEDTIAMMRNVEISENVLSTESSLHIERINSWREIPRDRYNDLMVLIVQDRCVYDYKNSDQWVLFTEEIKHKRKEKLSSEDISLGSICVPPLSLMDRLSLHPIKEAKEEEASEGPVANGQASAIMDRHKDILMQKDSFNDLEAVQSLSIYETPVKGLHSLFPALSISLMATIFSFLEDIDLVCNYTVCKRFQGKL